MPADSRIILDVAVLCQLYENPKPHWLPAHTGRDLIEKEVRRLRCGRSVVQIFRADKRQHAIPAVSARASGIRETKCGHCIIRFPCKARRYRLGRLDECQRGGMLAKELLDGVRVWTGRIRRDQSVEEFQKLLHGARWEAVHRVRHYVGVNVLSEMKANREAARTGILRVIVS